MNSGAGGIRPGLGRPGQAFDVYKLSGGKPGQHRRGPDTRPVVWLDLWSGPSDHGPCIIGFTW